MEPTALCSLISIVLVAVIVLNFNILIMRVLFFLIRAVGLWVLRPLLAYCTSPG
jgi:hypothetical protein